MKFLGGFSPQAHKTWIFGHFFPMGPLALRFFPRSSFEMKFMLGFCPKAHGVWNFWKILPRDLFKMKFS